MTLRKSLQDARRLVERSESVDAWSRSAAFLARRALEDCVRHVIERRWGKILRPTFAAQLIVLRELVKPETAREIAWVWTALSSATHAHAYELPPTGAELLRWIDAVDRLASEIDAT